MMLKDAGMVDSSLTLNHILTVFNSIQHSDDELGLAEEAEVMASELVFAEFLEGMAACAVFKIPNPCVCAVLDYGPQISSSCVLRRGGSLHIRPQATRIATDPDAPSDPSIPSHPKALQALGHTRLSKLGATSN